MSAQLGHLPDDIPGEISEDLADRVERVRSRLLSDRLVLRYRLFEARAAIGAEVEPALLAPMRADHHCDLTQAS